MNMKKLIESMDRIEECGMTEMPAMAPPAPEMDKGNPVTVNVSMNASGKEHVADLLDMMKNAGLGGAEPVSAKMLSPRMDMERLSGIMDEPGFDDKEMPTFDVVSKIDLAEVSNAVSNLLREIEQRYDFKGSHCEVVLNKDTITVNADDDLKLRQIHEILKGHLSKRNIEHLTSKPKVQNKMILPC